MELLAELNVNMVAAAKAGGGVIGRGTGTAIPSGSATAKTAAVASGAIRGEGGDEVGGGGHLRVGG